MKDEIYLHASIYHGERQQRQHSRYHVLWSISMYHEEIEYYKYKGNRVHTMMFPYG